jgi:hypothetical protein
VQQEWLEQRVNLASADPSPYTIPVRALFRQGSPSPLVEIDDRLDGAVPFRKAALA